MSENSQKLEILKKLIGTDVQVTIKFDGGYTKAWVIAAPNELQCVFALDKSRSRTTTKPVDDVISLN